MLAKGGVNAGRLQNEASLGTARALAACQRRKLRRRESLHSGPRPFALGRLTPHPNQVAACVDRDLCCGARLSSRGGSNAQRRQPRQQRLAQCVTLQAPSLHSFEQLGPARAQCVCNEPSSQHSCIRAAMKVPAAAAAAAPAAAAAAAAAAGHLLPTHAP